jgi:hypothetical protein
VYPWGDITVHAQLTVTQTANWNYLAHRFSFGVSPYSFSNNGTTYNWGGNYRPDGESYFAWTDGAPGGNIGENFYEYSRTISTTTNENSVSYNFGHSDQYSGFMIDDANGNDPDIIVMSGDQDIYQSPFQQIPMRLSTAGGIGAYIETALFNISWAPSNESVAQMTYFYMTTPSNQYGVQTTWPTSLGTWEETFHVMLRRNMGGPDYVPFWKAHARDVAQAMPVVSGGSVAVDHADKLYHVTASSAATTVQIQWTRSASAAAGLDYRTAFVVDQFDPSYVQLQGVGQPALDSYYDAATHTTLLVLSGVQSGSPQTYTIVLGK